MSVFQHPYYRRLLYDDIEILQIQLELCFIDDNIRPGVVCPWIDLLSHRVYHCTSAYFVDGSSQIPKRCIQVLDVRHHHSGFIHALLLHDLKHLLKCLGIVLYNMILSTQPESVYINLP